MEKNFNKIYEEIYKEENEYLNKIRVKNRLKITLGIMLGIFTVILAFYYIFDSDETVLPYAIVLGIITLVFCFMCYKDYVRYKGTFKKHVIKKMISIYNNKLSFEPQYGIRRDEYAKSNFEQGFDFFESEDSIIGTIGNASNLKMSQVKTTLIIRDPEGERMITSFFGLYGYVKLENSAYTNIDILRNSNGIVNSFRNIKNQIEVKTKLEPLHYTRYPKEKIEIDSGEFEKYYDFYADDKIMALRIVTSELIEKFVRAKELSNFKLEFKIAKDRLYFRYGCGEAFEPTTFKEALDYEVLHNYFKMIDIPLSLVEAFIEHINGIDL